MRARCTAYRYCPNPLGNVTFHKKQLIDAVMNRMGPMVCRLPQAFQTRDVSGDSPRNDNFSPK